MIRGVFTEFVHYFCINNLTFTVHMLLNVTFNHCEISNCLINNWELFIKMLKWPLCYSFHCTLVLCPGYGKWIIILVIHCSRVGFFSPLYLILVCNFLYFSLPYWRKRFLKSVSYVVKRRLIVSQLRCDRIAVNSSVWEAIDIKRWNDCDKWARASMLIFTWAGKYIWNCLVYCWIGCTTNNV